MRDFLPRAVSRYRVSALTCAVLTGLVALSASWASPELYYAESVTWVSEPLIVHWLANPSARVPESKQELADIQELLMSREKLVATAKRIGLLDRWDEGRPWALRTKDRLQAAIFGPVDDKDRLEALVKMLERRVFVSVDGSKVIISAQWGSPMIALAIVEAQVGALTQLRVRREMKAVEAQAKSLDDQYAGLREDMAARLERISVAWKAADWAVVSREHEQLKRDQLRSTDLLVQAEQKHIAAEVFRSSNALRFTPLRLPRVERRPIGLPMAARVAVGVAASLVAGLVCAVMLAMVSGRLISKGQVERETGLPVLGGLRLRGGGEIVEHSRLALLLAGGIALTTGVAVGFTHSHPVFSLLAPLLIVGAWLLWTRPLKWPLLALLFVAVTGDDPTGRPYYRVWQSPFWDLGRIAFTNIAFFTGFELAVYGLTVVMVIRRVFRSARSLAGVDPVAGQAPRPLQYALMVSVGFIAWLVVFGVLRGGVFREALWQFRALLLLPFIGLLASYAFEFPRDLPKLLGVLMAGSIIKGALGSYFIYAIASPRGIDPPHTTGHHDSMIFVTAVVTAIAMLWEHPSSKNLRTALLWMPMVALGLRFNDRRVAYVEIAMALMFIYALSPWQPVKRFITRAAVIAMPVVLLYMAAGWNARHSPVFAPVQKVRSIIAPAQETEENSSNVERDIENYNIVTTWKENMFLGQGFGHAFREFVPSNDFSQSSFGHVGHNSILWVLWIGGVIGFTGVFGYIAVALYFLGRTLQVATDWKDRVALLAALSIILTYLLQAFGDMGTQSALIDFFVGCALAIIGRLATRWGVWREVPSEQPATTAVLAT